MKIKEMQNKVSQFRDERDWKKFHNPKDMALSLSLEASEFLEHFQWKDGAELDKYIVEHKDDLGDELSDVLYWVLLVAEDLDINIEQAFLTKLKKNELKYPIHKAKGNKAKYTEL